MFIIRNILEFIALFVIWATLQWCVRQSLLTPFWLTNLILAIAWAKTAFFGGENLQQLWKASAENMAYHRFMMLMLVNMSQIILSFGLDYHCLYCVDHGSFSSIQPLMNTPELVFEFFYFSVLNFTFFGYGDITPRTVSAKLLTMTEVILAFVTVIFLLSDFISLKESISTKHNSPNNPSKKPEGA